jgi:hypothetical protein
MRAVLLAGLLTAIAALLGSSTSGMARGTNMHEMQNSHWASSEESHGEPKLWGRDACQHYSHKPRTTAAKYPHKQAVRRPSADPDRADVAGIRGY